MIKLTQISGVPVWLNPDMIQGMFVAENKTVVFAVEEGDTWRVKETPEQITDKILNWKAQVSAF